MKNRSFEYVYTVFQEGSFSKAAAKLYISQPALSAAIKKVETLMHTLPLPPESGEARLISEAPPTSAPTSFPAL